MRIAALLTLPLLGALIAAPTPAAAQLNIAVHFGARLGPEVRVNAYSQARQGDWRNNYRRWTPVTMYNVNGRYYRNSVSGARAVTVYSFDHEYFLPPQDRTWVGVDRRYNYRRQPNSDDYGQDRPYVPAVAVDTRLGNEIGVLGYSSDRDGDWRTNSRRWTPVTAYEMDGRYYPNNVAGARAVGMYRYQNEYFLPPSDQAWIGSDTRFNYRNQPNSDDRSRVRVRP